MLREKNVLFSAEKALATLMNNYFVNITADFGYFKTWGTPMEYPIGVPTGVHLCCSIWTSFWNVLISYFIYSVVKAMEPGWSFVKKLDRGRASFLRYWHLNFTPPPPPPPKKKKLILTVRHLYQNLEVEHFRIVTHCYEGSFLWKLILC